MTLRILFVYFFVMYKNYADWHNTGPHIQYIIYILIYNICMYLYISQWTLTHYGMPYPLALTCAHMAFSFVVLLPLSLKIDIQQHVTSLQNQWVGLLFIGSSMALNIALNNISLLYVSLALNQIIRSSIPVVTCIMSILVEQKFPCRMESLSLLILCFGVVIVVWEGSVSGQPLGIFLCLLGTISNALMMTLSSKLLSQKFDVIRLTFYTAPVSLMCLIPFMLRTEYTAFAMFVRKNAFQASGIVLAGCVNALFYNLVHSMIIKKTSAVTSTVLGQVKVIGLVILAIFILDEKKVFNFKIVSGSLIALTGVFLYSRVEIKRLQKRDLTPSSESTDLYDKRLMMLPADLQHDSESD